MSGYVVSRVDRQSGLGKERMHRVVASKVIGRRLPSRHVIHHVDDNGGNNRNDNLVILENQSEHVGLHYRRSVLRAGGDPFRDVLCDMCRQPIQRDVRVGASKRCRPCHLAYQTQWAARKEIRRQAGEKRPCLCGCGKLVPVTNYKGHTSSGCARNHYHRVYR